MVGGRWRSYAPPQRGGTLCRNLPTWSSPTLPGGANFVSPSEWLQISRARGAVDAKLVNCIMACVIVCGAQMFHLAACQMKLVVSAPIGAATFEPFRWRHKVSPGRKAWGCPPPHLQLTESRRVAAGRMSANARLPITPYTPRVAPLRGPIPRQARKTPAPFKAQGLMPARQPPRRILK